MDSRGWSTRGASENTAGAITPGFQKSARIAGGTAVQNQQEEYAEYDILDPLNNQAANTMMQLNRAAQIEHRRSIIDQLKNPVSQAASQHTYEPRTANGAYQNQPQQAQAQNTVNGSSDPAIMNLLQNNDLTISGIVRQANNQQ